MIATRDSARPRRPPRRRWLLWGFRALVVALLFVLLLLGIRDIVRGVVQSTNQSGAPNLAQAGFPQQAAEAYASRFALAYATFDSANPQAHVQAVQQYVPDGVDPMLGWDGQGKQTATTALPSGINVQNQSSATVSVALLVDRGRWLYLAVPVAVNQNRLVVAGAPALIPPPAKASVPAPNVGSDDAQLEGQLNPLLTNFFKAYASSSSTDLGLIAAPGVTIQGLNGAVQFATLVDLHINQNGGERRQAIAHVRWSDTTSGASLVQGYQLTLQLVNGQWHVGAVAPAGT
jgi:Conjugative transposon protein TcpC